MTTTSQASLAAGQWVVDIDHSTATFQVSSFGRQVTGTVPILTGVVDIASGGSPSAIMGSLNLGAIDTGNARRDCDLRKPKFLDLDRHPVINFTADSMTASLDGWQVSGYLTVSDTRVRLSGHVDLSGQPRGVVLTACTTLDRRAVGIRAPRFLMGHQVDITITAAIRPADDAQDSDAQDGDAQDGA